MQGKISIKRILLSTILFVYAAMGLSQEDLNIYGSVKEVETNHKMESVQVQVLQDNKTFDSYTTSGNSRFEFDLPLGFVYEIIFSKNGYTSKRIQLNTKYIPEEDQEGGFKLDLDMTLFEQREGFDETILEEPIGIAQYDALKNSIEFDFGYTERIMKKVEAENIRLDNLDQADVLKRKKYEELLVTGSDNMTKEMYDRAISNYTEALDLYPDESIPQEKLAEAEKLLALQNQDAELEANYQKFMKDGKSEMKAGDYEAAKASFEGALGLKDSEPEPKEKLRELEELIAAAGDQANFDELMANGDSDMGKEDYQSAVDNYKAARDIFPGDKDVKKKLAEAQDKLNELLDAADAEAALEKRYQDFIDKGDSAMASEDYKFAITQYQSALEVKETEKYPKDKIKEAEEKLAEQEQEKEDALANAEEDELQAEYDALISTANDQFTKEDLEEARATYTKALDLKKEEKYPKQRIARINDLLAEKERLANELAEASEQSDKEKERLAELEREKQRLAALEEERQRKLEEDFAEQERLAEEERQKKLDAEKRRRILASNIDPNAERQAEEFYDKMREDEENSKLSESEKYKRDRLNWLRDKQEEAKYMGRAKDSEVTAVKQSMTKIYSEGENYQTDKAQNFDAKSKEVRRTEEQKISEANSRRKESEIKLEAAKEGQIKLTTNQQLIQDNAYEAAQRKKEYEQNQEGYIQKGDVLRKDNQYQVERYKEELVEMQDDGETERARSQKEVEENIKQQKKFNRENVELQNERLEMNAEKLQQNKADAQLVATEDKSIREGNAAEVEFKKNQNKELQTQKESQAALKRQMARDEAFSAGRGQKKDVDDYLTTPETAEIAEGVTERSYEINNGRKLVIERTVKIGNKVDIYSKVIDKNAIYYFKNNKSLTKNTWERETLNLED